MNTWVIEMYAGNGPTRELHHRACRTAEAMNTEDRAIRYLRTLVLPADETCFHVLEAATIDDVALLAKRAGLHVLRIAEAEEWNHASTSRPTTRERR